MTHVAALCLKTAQSAALFMCMQTMSEGWQHPAKGVDFHQRIVPPPERIHKGNLKQEATSNAAKHT